MKIKGGTFMVTGGISLIGSHVTEQLLEQGAKGVILFDNYSLGTTDMIGHILKDDRVRLVRGDITRVGELYNALDGVDGIFAIAGFLTLPFSANPELGITVNALGHVNVLEAARYRGVKKVIFSSSVATYGDPEPGLIDETRPFRFHTMTPPGVLYGSTKIMGEQLGRLYSDRYGVQSVSLRYATVYGERQHYRGVNALYIIDTYDKLMKGERPQIPGDGSEVHDYIHVADVARANLMAMDSDVTAEAFNVATGTATTLNRLFEIIAGIVGSDVTPEYGDKAGAVRVTTSSQLDFSIGKIGRMIGWKPEVSIEDGIARLIDWRRAQG
ncbi:NAD dependent epimerase/dehydratase [Primorskyibacter flagellatus]|uniref:NAD dependent epimerase/dehydratase n=1 Tax=Primorskyibacter flagellatus TaxID=1387277 RepID=A0A917AGJ1_9RHOB|nr:NAD-dependent epimerase/dehydratase family protein [Primorskyibacter flagellatus]GGE51158.1 NAD dependent epimerase/dehydratase [Primorskyibacter flagellatus]